MTTYSAITSGQTDAESYIDTVLAGQWANNLLGVIEGDASASTARIADDLAMSSITDGATYTHGADLDEKTSNATSFTQSFVSIVVPRGGTYRTSFELKTDNSIYTAHGRVYKNGVALGTDHTKTGDTSYTAKADTALTLAGGDLLEIYYYISNSAANVLIKNFKLTAAVKPFG